MTRLEELTKCIKKLSADAVNTLLDAVKILLASESTAGIPDCPYCGSTEAIRYGHKCGKQRFLCKQCGRTFATTTHTIMKSSATRYRGMPLTTAPRNWASATARYLICAIRCSLHYRNSRKQKIFCLTAYLNWMRLLSLNPIRGRPFQRL